MDKWTEILIRICYIIIHEFYLFGSTFMGQQIVNHADELFNAMWVTIRIFYIKLYTNKFKKSVLIIFLINFHEFLHKDYAFRGFSPCPDPFLECQRFMNLAVHFIRTRSSLILSYSSGPFLLYYLLCYLLKWWRGREEKLWMRGERWEKLISLQ